MRKMLVIRSCYGLHVAVWCGAVVVVDLVYKSNFDVVVDFGWTTWKRYTSRLPSSCVSVLTDIDHLPPEGKRREVSDRQQK